MKQANLSKNNIIKGIPEIERYKEDVKILVKMLFAHLKIKDLANNVDCHRIGSKTDDNSRPIQCTLSTVHAKNMVINTKRKKVFTCAELSIYGKS